MTLAVPILANPHGLTTATEAMLPRISLFAAPRPHVLRRVKRRASGRNQMWRQRLFSKGDGATTQIVPPLRGRVSLSLLSAAARDLSLRHVGLCEVLGKSAAFRGNARDGLEMKPMQRPAHAAD